jgi:hypothetical protein
MGPSADAFVSYSRRDAGFLTRLVERRQARGKDVWVDTEGIRAANAVTSVGRRAGRSPRILAQGYWRAEAVKSRLAL